MVISTLAIAIGAFSIHMTRSKTLIFNTTVPPHVRSQTGATDFPFQLKHRDKS